MALGRLKKILCNFEFNYLGIRYMACGFYLGDTASPKAIVGKDFTPTIVCQTLKISKILGYHSRKISQSRYYIQQT